MSPESIEAPQNRSTKIVKRPANSPTLSSSDQARCRSQATGLTKECYPCVDCHSFTIGMIDIVHAAEGDSCTLHDPGYERSVPIVVDHEHEY